MASNSISATKMMKYPIVRRTITAVSASRGGGRAALHSACAPGFASNVALLCSASTSTRSILLARAGSGSGVVARKYRFMSSSGTTGLGLGDNSDSSSGRFSQDLENLISRAGEKADRSSTLALAKSGKGAAAAVTPQGGEGGGAEEEEDQKLSARAMRFRAIISKLRPQKKVVVVKTFTPSREPLVDNLGRSYGLGRRKTSTARVWISLSHGHGGVFMVNSRPMIDYFPRDHLQNEILKPLEFTGKLGSFNVRCTAKGEGQSGQAGAIRLGLARALEAHDPWLRKFLKKEGMMERDSRKVERKKPGLKKARKAPQWVKR